MLSLKSQSSSKILGSLEPIGSVSHSVQPILKFLCNWQRTREKAGKTTRHQCSSTFRTAWKGEMTTCMLEEANIMEGWTVGGSKHVQVHISVVLPLPEHLVRTIKLKLRKDLQLQCVCPWKNVTKRQSWIPSISSTSSKSNSCKRSAKHKTDALLNTPKRLWS